MTTKIRVPDLTPRDYQLPFFKAMDSGLKRAVLVWHRRAGKEIACWNYMIREACCGRVGTYCYFFPTSRLGRRILWDGANKDGKRFVDYIPKPLIKGQPNSVEMKIELTNGSVIQIMGTDMIINVGINPIGCIFSEYSLQDPKSWDFVRPILRENGGWAIFNYTPRGKNHAYDLYMMARDNPDWFCQKLSIEDTKVLSSEDMEIERSEGMSENLIQQEYYCFPPGQMVMTIDGMTPIEEVKPNALVLTHTGRWRKVLKTFKRHYEGELVRIKSFGSKEDIASTPTHRIREYQRTTQKYRWKQAKYFEHKDRLVFPKLSAGGIPIVQRELCELIAWYICEGSTFKNACQFTVGNSSEASEIQRLAEKNGYKCSEISSATAINIVINDVALADFMKSHCGTESNDKRIPMSLISGHERAVFDVLMRGDGCYSVHNDYHKYSYVTVSQTLAYQVQLLANSIGYTAGITYKDAYTGILDGREINCQKSYQVNIGNVRLRQEGTKLIKAKYAVCASVREVDTVSYSGPVYNLEVQYDNSYTVNGRAVHNCNFNQGIDGAYYAKYLGEAEKDERICSVPVDPYAPVDTYWDLGVSDSTAIIFAQNVGNEIHIIDTYTNEGEGLDHYARILRKKADEGLWQYGRHCAPHDIKVRELGHGAKTRLQMARDLGIDFEIVPNLSIMEGIEMARGMWHKLWIDKNKCTFLIKCAENYHRVYNERLNVYSDKPSHDWSSHMMDAFRYMAVMQNKSKRSKMTEDEAAKLEQMYASRY